MTGKDNLLKGHLVICGWKQEMSTLVLDLLSLNKQWQPNDVVIVAKVSSSIIGEFQRDPLLAQAHIIREEHFNEKFLVQAGINQASKIMILADWSNKNESATETDAKTVMAAMTIKKLAPQVYVIAELLDLSFTVYLKMANVDEIIYSREYSRILLANSVSSAGIAHVVYDLLDVQKDCKLDALPISDQYVGKTFGELCHHLEEDEKIICIGVLENTGNLRALKKQALAEAQKSPEMRTVLAGLKHVREIEANIPKLNPGDDYILSANSRVVILRSSRDQEKNPINPSPHLVTHSEEAS